MALLRTSIALFLLLLWPISAWAQDRTVDAAFDGASIDLLPHLLSVDTDRPVVTIRTAEDANGLLMDAFYTDVRADLAEWRAGRGLPADPMASYRSSGYGERIVADRVGGDQAGWGA